MTVYKLTLQEGDKTLLDITSNLNLNTKQEKDLKDELAFLINSYKSQDKPLNKEIVKEIREQGIPDYLYNKEIGEGLFRELFHILDPENAEPNTHNPIINIEHIPHLIFYLKLRKVQLKPNLNLLHPLITNELKKHNLI